MKGVDSLMLLFRCVSQCLEAAAGGYKPFQDAKLPQEMGARFRYCQVAEILGGMGVCEFVADPDTGPC